MFDIGFSEMLVLAAIALIAIGPKQLPEVARSVGRALNELKRMTNDITRTIVDTRDSATDHITNWQKYPESHPVDGQPEMTQQHLAAEHDQVNHVDSHEHYHDPHHEYHHDHHDDHQSDHEHVHHADRDQTRESPDPNQISFDLTDAQSNSSGKKES